MTSKNREELNKISAITIDRLIETCKRYVEIQDESIISKLKFVFVKMSSLEKQGDDEYRRIWFTASRGNLEDFGDYKEAIEDGEVDSQEEFEELWEYYYPEKTKWYNFAVSKYREVYYFYVDSILIFQFEENCEHKQAYDFQKELADELFLIVDENIKRIKEDLRKYNVYISSRLPHKKRTGRIKRSDFWFVSPECKDEFNNQISTEMLKILYEITIQLETPIFQKLSEMNSGDFFRFCEIGYDANGYFDDSKTNLSAKEKYNTMADRRDCGLKKLNDSSNSEFINWYQKESSCGGHPWEICRGGNSTHISLFINMDEGGWSLRLAGSSRARVIETIKMAVALYQQQVPFILDHAEEIYKIAKGIDYIGIVPEGVIPRYCHGYFPQEDKIIDFMNLDDEKSNEIIKLAYWYPLKEVGLNL
ncbi:MAG: hypothetical protein KAI81_00545 [Candidatus Marinimicrobia bacterium]|nr:hypothetical protein [Candidatus Neomarinimicrobiota bacterium]